MQAWSGTWHWGKAEEDVENISEFLKASWPLGEMHFGILKNENKEIGMVTLTEKTVRKGKKIEERE